MSLHLVSLCHRFGSQKALDDVSLNVPRGVCYGFLGHNGAGKTTALRIALGLIRAERGHVIVDGFDAARFPREARARMGGLIETPGFHPGDDGRSNLLWLAKMQGLSGAAARREVGRVLELIGLSKTGGKPVRAFSQGMRQRLGIAQALLGNPTYVLLDEPTNGLDPEGIAEVRDLLSRLARESGLTVLLSSHQLAEITGLCGRIGVLRQGRLLLEADTDEVLQAKGRYVVETDRADDVVKHFEGTGVTVLERHGAALTIDVGEAGAAQVARLVVDSGAELRALRPVVPTLEDVYLRSMQGGLGAAAAVTVVPVLSVPETRRAPRFPTLRLFRHELVRALSRPGLLALLLGPAAIAAVAIWRRHDEVATLAEDVANKKLASTTQVTAFQGVAEGLTSGLPLLMFVLAGFASQLVAADFSRGTLRHLLMRPIRRWQVALGKVFALLVVVTLAWAALAGTSVAAGALVFDFSDVFEVLPNGKRYLYVSAETLWPALRRVLMLPLLPLAAYAGLGFAMGAVVRSGTGALVATLTTAVGLELARAPARSGDWERWLPSAHLPSPLSDTSVVKWYGDAVQGISNALDRYASEAFLTPALWIAATFLLAGWLVIRRPFP